MRFEGLSAGMNQVIGASHFDTVLSVEEKLGALVETVGRNPAGWPRACHLLVFAAIAVIPAGDGVRETPPQDRASRGLIRKTR
jgi:hypothetical protein